MSPQDKTDSNFWRVFFSGFLFLIQTFVTKPKFIVICRVGPSGICQLQEHCFTISGIFGMEDYWVYSFYMFGSKSQCEKLNHSFPVNILGNLILLVDAVRNLGVWFYSDFSFSCHVMKVYKACFAHVLDLK